MPQKKFDVTSKSWRNVEKLTWSQIVDEMSKSWCNVKKLTLCQKADITPKSWHDAKKRCQHDSDSHNYFYLHVSSAYWLYLVRLLFLLGSKWFASSCVSTVSLFPTSLSSCASPMSNTFLFRFFLFGDSDVPLKWVKCNFWSPSQLSLHHHSDSQIFPLPQDLEFE